MSDKKIQDEGAADSGSKDAPQNVSVPAELLQEMIVMARGINAIQNTKPVYPDHEAFKAGEGYHVIKDGVKYRHGDHPEGRATILDDKGRPVGVL